MKYYLIAGEASGDLHASHLMRELRLRDAQAQFRCIGGDLMMAQGAELVRHYRDLAYMGLWPVLVHLPSIIRAMRECQRDVVSWQPDVLILVDYPGFNLRMARYVKQHTQFPVFYYIAPKLWAWKEYRIKDIRRYVDCLFSILPFEVDFFEHKHNYPIHYVGNPTVDEVVRYQAMHPKNETFLAEVLGTDRRPLIALLPGSRKQEIRDNLVRMAKAVSPLRQEYVLVVAGAPGIDEDFYRRFAPGVSIRVVYGNTYALLQHATAALVTSGTATLEAALFRVPQVVCYYMRVGRLANWVRPWLLNIPFVSLVNLIAGREVVPELIAADMSPKNVYRHLTDILPGGAGREAQLSGYERVAELLGEPGAPAHAAQGIQDWLQAHETTDNATLKA